MGDNDQKTAMQHSKRENEKKTQGYYSIFLHKRCWLDRPGFPQMGPLVLVGV